MTDKIVRSGVVGRGTIKIWFGVGLLHFAMPVGKICTFTPLFCLEALVRQSTVQNNVWMGEREVGTSRIEHLLVDVDLGG